LILCTLEEANFADIAAENEVALLLFCFLFDCRFFSIMGRTSQKQQIAKDPSFLHTPANVELVFLIGSGVYKDTF